jgi:hypothetical protein
VLMLLSLLRRCHWLHYCYCNRPTDCFAHVWLFLVMCRHSRE